VSDGASYRAEALQDDGFAPGRKLVLVTEPQHEHDPSAVLIAPADAWLGMPR